VLAGINGMASAGDTGILDMCSSGSLAEVNASQAFNNLWTDPGNCGACL
jgi:hypothetical protein